MSRFRERAFSLLAVIDDLLSNMAYIEQVYAGGTSAFANKNSFEKFVRYALKNDRFFCSVISRNLTNFFKRDEIQILVPELINAYETYTLEKETAD